MTDTEQRIFLSVQLSAASLQMTTMRNRIVFSGVINSAHDFKISRTVPFIQWPQVLQKRSKGLNET